MTDFNRMQTIKRRFYAMRNGILADTLRKGGSPYEMIFGLNLPQLNTIAQEIAPDSSLALELLEDRRTRESQLLASFVMPIEEIKSIDDSIRWIDSLRSAEAIDIACLKLLKNTCSVIELAKKCIDTTDYNKRYAGLRLLWNIYNKYPGECREIASDFTDEDSRLIGMAKTLIEEIDYITSDN